MGRKAKGLNKNKKNFNIEHPIQEVPGSGNLVTEEVEPEMREELELELVLEMMMKNMVTV